MIGILICGRSPFARSMIEAAQTLCGSQPYLTALDYELSTDIHNYDQALKNQIEAWTDETDGILCLCDMQGGYAMEACLTQLSDMNVKIITETTLTLLTYLLVHRSHSQSLNQLINNALLEAKEAIYVIDPQILFADQRGEEK